MNKIHIRNYRKKDFNDFLEFIIDTNQQDRYEAGITPSLLNENLNHPVRDPEKDVFIAQQKGKIIGFCEIFPEIQIKRVLLDALVHPEYRRCGVASSLLHKAFNRIIALGADFVHVEVPDTHVPAKQFLSKHGFFQVRRYLNMVLDLDRTDPAVDQEAEKNQGLQIRPCQQGEEDTLCKIQNYCFKQSWGFKPNTVDEIDYLINTSGCSPEDVIFCLENDQPVGYCWTKINPEENQNRERKKGRIHMLGVDPDYRGSGLGRKALIQGIQQLKTKGITIVELTTDSVNQPAYELYESVGFKHCSTRLWFEKQLV